MNESPTDEAELLIELVFKPMEPGQRLRPAETQLLLAYMSEILQEVALEEQRILEEEKAAKEQEDKSCK